MKRISLSVLTSSFALAAAMATGSAASAQVFTPTFMGPASSGDVGVYVSEAAGGTAIEGIWRQRASSYDLGLRAGFIDAGDGALSVGAEIRSPLHVQSEPISLALTAGAQGVFGGGNAIGIQGGITAGHTFVPGPFTLSPYVHPRIALSRPLGDGGDFGAHVLADLGVDLGFQPNLAVRFNVGLSSHGPDWGLGLAFRR
ncbi:MAG TPA: hypothetical protein VFH27_05870 [Longimicrobiaceae bacterium]|nr:hypothetical protein [Longimicrobiaceae bacterium]